MSRTLGWYARRLRQMSPAEIASRGTDQARQAVWARRQVHPGRVAALPPGLLAERGFACPLPHAAADDVAPEAAAALVAAADRLLGGEWSLLGVRRPDIVDPDWFLDPATGRRAPHERLAFRIDHRDEALTGNVKNVWELSRHHHLTVLAAAYWLTGDDRYAETVAAQLRSWWVANPFLSGVHWTSGIELGVRLLGWVWIRRLLDAWPGVGGLFEDDDDALRQIWWHQSFLAAFTSRGSSANNHVVAEAAGRLAAACAFPWYAESERWRADSARQLGEVLTANTFPSGINRELATDYHGFVTELGLLAAIEAEAAGATLERSVWSLLCRSTDAAAALVDETGAPPRQGDSDEGRALVVDDPESAPWSLLLDIGAAVFGPLTWWPATTGSVAAVAVGALGRRGSAGSHTATGERPDRAPASFADAGVCLLRSPRGDGPEIWCRADAGPHGFLSIAAHAHADALALEVRYAGVPVLADPGTYCYHGEPEWRSYFRSTLAHNTVEIGGVNQSREGGPFMWTSQATSSTDLVETDDARDQTWAGHVTGLDHPDPSLRETLRHDRRVTLRRDERRLVVVDRISSSAPVPVRMAYHLGPDVRAELAGSVARLSWSTPAGPGRATMLLPGTLRWSAHTGETAPVLGWYSPRFGRRVPTTTLVGAGVLTDAMLLDTVLDFTDSAAPPAPGTGVRR